MDTHLTKDTDKILCKIYKRYLELRKSGSSKIEATTFLESEAVRIELMPEINKDDFSCAIRELHKVFGIKVFTAGGFVLNDQVIIYMENRFPEGLNQVLEWLAKIKNAIPFA